MRPLGLFTAAVLIWSGAAIAQENVAAGTGVVLRGLDKVDGDVVDLTLQNGETGTLGRLSVKVGDCRYPRATASDSYAYLTIFDTPSQDVVFDGWMIASSPALNALEHPRYDVWVLRCKTD